MVTVFVYIAYCSHLIHLESVNFQLAWLYSNKFMVNSITDYCNSWMRLSLDKVNIIKLIIYPHMPIGKVWIYHLLLVCLFLFLL